jgi:MFS family permease
VSYLVQIRHDPLSTAGYLPTGFYGGLFLGRLLLPEPTHHFGERRMLGLYALCCLALQLVFWLVPSLVASVVTFTLMGLFLGPFFAAVSYFMLSSSLEFSSLLHRDTLVCEHALLILDAYSYQGISVGSKLFPSEIQPTALGKSPGHSIVPGNFSSAASPFAP